MLRLGTVADLKQLLEIEEQAFASDLIDAHYFVKFLTKNGTSCHLWVATNDSPYKVIGYILILTPKNRLNAVIHSFVVAKDEHGTGLGAILIDKGCEIAKSRNMNIMTHVRVDNPHAIRRYKKSGFHIIGAEANYYEDGCDAVKYLRKLI